MRKRMILVAPGNANNFRLTSPGVLRRLASCVIITSANTAGERITLNYNVGGAAVAQCTAGANPTTAGTTSFILGGVSIVGTAADPVCQGVALDAWFGPDFPVDLQCTAPSGLTITSVTYLVEEKDIEPDPA